MTLSLLLRLVHKLLLSHFLSLSHVEHQTANII